MRFFISLLLSLVLHFSLLFSDKVAMLIKTQKKSQVYIPTIKIQIQQSKKELTETSMIKLESFNENSKVVNLNKNYSQISKNEQDFYEKIKSIVYTKWHNQIENQYDDFKEDKLKETIVAFKMNKSGTIIDKMIQVPSVSKLADQIALNVLDSSITLPAPPQDVIINHDFIVLIMGFSIK